MAYVEDEGGTFEASLDVVWEYFEHEDHDKAHKSTRNASIEAISDTSFHLSAEREFDGAWHLEKERVTVFRPLGYLIETLQGPFAGSKWVVIYRPRGQQTRIDVYGNFVSPTIPFGSIGPAVLRMLDRDFNEDAPLVKAFASERGTPRAQK